MRHVMRGKCCALILVFTCASFHAHGQTSPGTGNAISSPASNERSQDRTYGLPPGDDPQNQLGTPFIRHLAEDQKHFWTFPARLRTRDLKWILPAAAGTAGLMAS